MFRKVNLMLGMLLIGLSQTVAWGQGGGLGGGGFDASFGGGGFGTSYNPNRTATSNNLNSDGAIQVSGASKISVKPQALRLVLALTTKGESADDCSQDIATRIKAIRQSLSTINIADKDIVEDFIMVKQSYQWEIKKQDNRDFLVESENGFRMQTNLHILCKNETTALDAIRRAFKQGVKEVVSFDYWHEDLDRYKQEALKKALAAAKSKSEILLSVFDKRPRVMNVGNKISVSHPSSQYKTLVPDKTDSNRVYSYTNVPKVFAEHPSITFYQGDNTYSDDSPPSPPMDPNISVVATVTLTFESPREREFLELRKAEIEKGIRNRNEDTQSYKERRRSSIKDNSKSWAAYSEAHLATRWGAV